jgi:hypothetical protein
MGSATQQPRSEREISRRRKPTAINSSARRVLNLQLRRWPFLQLKPIARRSSVRQDYSACSDVGALSEIAVYVKNVYTASLPQPPRLHI